MHRAVHQRTEHPLRNQCVVELDFDLEPPDVALSAVNLAFANLFVLRRALGERLGDGGALAADVGVSRAVQSRHDAGVQVFQVLTVRRKLRTKNLRQPLLVALARELVGQERAAEALADAVTRVVVFRHLVAVVNHLLVGGEFLAVLANGADARVRDLGGKFLRRLVGDVWLAALLDVVLHFLDDLADSHDLTQVLHVFQNDWVGEAVLFFKVAEQLRGADVAHVAANVVTGVAAVPSPIVEVCAAFSVEGFRRDGDRLFDAAADRVLRVDKIDVPDVVFFDAQFEDREGGVKTLDVHWLEGGWNLAVGRCHVSIIPRNSLKSLGIAVLFGMTDQREQHALKLETLENKAFTVVKGVIDRNDPEMLLKVGAPSDEYDPISRRIAEGWTHNGRGRVGETGLAHIIALQWHYSFGDWTKPVPFFSVYFEMAKEMLPLMSWDTPTT